jgi:hypothetical protein
VETLTDLGLACATCSPRETGERRLLSRNQREVNSAHASHHDAWLESQKAA